MIRVIRDLVLRALALKNSWSRSARGRSARCSRLRPRAWRNGRDWHTLLEFCGFVGTLIIDEDGIYDPRHPNDRLLLGLKGTMSEMELSVLSQRAHEARKLKAERGELFMTIACASMGSIGRVDIGADGAIARLTICRLMRFHRRSPHSICCTPGLLSQLLRRRCLPRCATSGPMHCSKKACLFDYLVAE